MRPATFRELRGENGQQHSAPGAFTSFEDFTSLYRAAARLVREGPRRNLLRLCARWSRTPPRTGRSGLNRTSTL
nr:hypothetical protein [Streptomyces sp. CC0208]